MAAIRGKTKTPTLAPYKKPPMNHVYDGPPEAVSSIGPMIDQIIRQGRAKNSVEVESHVADESPELPSSKQENMVENKIERMTHVQIPPRPTPPAMARTSTDMRPLLRSLDREKKIAQQIKDLDEKQAQAKKVSNAPKRTSKRRNIESTTKPKALPRKAKVGKVPDPTPELQKKLKHAVKKSKTDADELQRLSRLLPRPIRLTLTDQPFNILEFTRNVEVSGLSLSQLLALSPALRRILGDSLKTLTSKEQLVLMAKNPSLGVECRAPEIFALLARTDLAKSTTHHFLATVNGHPTKPYLDGGACVNVCSPEFLKRANVTNVSNISKVTIRGMSGTQPALGEASQIPLEIAGQTVVIGCIVMNNVPFELLLGRGFLEMTKCVTNWESGGYELRLGGKTIHIDGGAGTAPVVVKEEEPEFQVSPKVKKGYRYLVSDDDNDTTDDGSTEDSDSDASYNSESGSEGSDADSDPDQEGYPEALIAALAQLNGSSVPYRSEQELLEDDDAGNIRNVFILAAVPRAEEDEILSGIHAEQILVDELSSPVYKNDDYGFHLECPTSRSVLTDTPCRLVPGLEDRSIQVGDLPEVNRRMGEIQELFQKYAEAFPKADEMSRTMDSSKLSGPATFTVKEDEPYPKAYSRKYSPGQIRVLTDYVKKMEKAGKIRRSSSPVSCNPLLVEKKDGTFRVCVNFIPVNKLIRPMAWPIPDALTEINKLQGCKYLSFWDCKDGYLQSPIAEHCKYLTAVAFPDGLWEYNVLPMGLIDSMQWYTRHMNDVFCTPALEGKLATFVDDMATGTQTLQQHLERIEQVLSRMNEVNGSFAGSKSGFFVERREFLGRVLGPEGMSAHPKKLNKVSMWPIPTNVKELRAFIGFCLFMGEFVSGFSKVAGLLFKLYRFDKRPLAFQKAWSEDPNFEQAFQDLQRSLLGSPVLILIDHRRPVIVSADTSGEHTGYVLAHAAYESDDDNITIKTVYRPILFGSRKLSGAESRYFATERELLGFVYVLRKNEHLLLDKVVHAFLDHKALLYLHNLQFQNARLTRWSLYVARFNVKIHHRPGRDMKDSDPLSRVPLVGPLPQHGLEDEIELLGGLRLVALVELHEEPYASIVAWLQGDTLSERSRSERIRIARQAAGFFVQAGSLMKRTVGANPRLYVPPLDRQQLIDTLHGSTTNGHLGIVGTFRLAAISYFWPRQYEDIKAAVQSCDACQRFQKKDPTRYRHHRIPPPPSIFLVVGMDIVGPLPPSHGKSYILSLIDYLSGWVESIALSDIQGTTIQREVKKHWFERYGLPQVIITDNGTSLAQGAFKKECDENHITIATASAYHPQTNGKIERYNGFLVQQLRRCLAENLLPENKWRVMLERVVWTWNTMEKEVQGYSPFEMLYGQPARTSLSNRYDPAVVDPVHQKTLNKQRRGMLALIRKTALDRINEEHRILERSSRLPRPREYHVGQSVLVYRPSLDKQWSKKLQPRWIGPLQISAKRAGGAYLVVQKKGLLRFLYRAGRPVNHTHLKPYRTPTRRTG